MRRHTKDRPADRTVCKRSNNVPIATIVTNCQSRFLAFLVKRDEQFAFRISFQGQHRHPVSSSLQLNIFRSGAVDSSRYRKGKGDIRLKWLLWTERICVLMEKACKKCKYNQLYVALNTTICT